MMIPLPGAWAAQDPPPVAPPQEVVVVGRAENLVGVADSAAEGKVGQEEIAGRPQLRAGEILEVIPGVIVTQHSGTGKANQYFLRGFNLDHGSDFAVDFEGIPLNARSHGHGQGYLDLNFLIPEVVETVSYRKGPYYAAAGDFASAGSASISVADSLDRGLLKLGLGEDRYGRLVVADSPALGGGRLLYAVEANVYDGPWDHPENLQKFSGLAKYSAGDQRRGGSLLPSFYTAEWDATDQIPARAVRQGLVSALGTLDRSDGGDSQRFSLGGRLWDRQGGQRSEANAYLGYSELDLFSNFTYFLNDPANGDQFEQVDQRWFAGGGAFHAWEDEWLGGVETEHTAGVQLQGDFLPEVGLHATARRRRLATIREDRVQELSAGVYYENVSWWAADFRTTAGLRGDLYRFDVDARTAANSGSESDAILSPKLGAAWQAFERAELYANAGLGFHSNDARGATIAVDPASGRPARPVDPLVRSTGAELGLRSVALRGLHTTVSLWWLELDSELLFVGDAGTTAASRPSRRYGLEWANFYEAAEWLTLDLDLSLSNARFRDQDPAGERIPGAIETVIASGATARAVNGLFGALRLRHFGPRPLAADDRVRSTSTTLVNLQTGCEVSADLSFHLDVLNLFDADTHDVDYFYTSRLPGEPAAGRDDLHFHPVEPLTLRLYMTLRF